MTRSDRVVLTLAIVALTMVLYVAFDALKQHQRENQQPHQQLNNLLGSRPAGESLLLRRQQQQQKPPRAIVSSSGSDSSSSSSKKTELGLANRNLEEQIALLKSRQHVADAIRRRNVVLAKRLKDSEDIISAKRAALKRKGSNDGNGKAAAADHLPDRRHHQQYNSKTGGGGGGEGGGGGGGGEGDVDNTGLLLPGVAVHGPGPQSFAAPWLGKIGRPDPPPSPPPGLSAAEVKVLEDKSHRRHYFNQYRSSLLPLDRNIPDPRIDECKSRDGTYDISQMPDMSVIICFVDEAWSTLLRTIWTVVLRTPPEVLREIVLVDDASAVDWLDPLESHIAAKFHGLVRLVRAPTRQGLIRARLLGARSAVGSVLLFLDSHCEVNRGWAEPMLDLIGREPQAVVTPVIDTIAHKDMTYASFTARIPMVGTFDWTMDFSWRAGKLTRPGQRPFDPVDSPTMAGGLFAMRRDYFWALGSYDAGMDGWGGENLEMSFRIWQCHGRLVTHPCSHVGHIFRDAHPYKVPGASIHHTFMRNSMRAAAVWMDDYAKYFYKTRPSSTEGIEVGDVSERLELRKRLQCRSFRWFMEHLEPDKWVPSPEQIYVQGALEGSRRQCLDKMGAKAFGQPGVYFCHRQGGNQYWIFSNRGELRTVDELCLDASGALPIRPKLYSCHGQKGNQFFDAGEDLASNPGTHTVLRHPASGGCLTVVKVGNSLQLQVALCTAGNRDQLWSWAPPLKDS